MDYKQELKKRISADYERRVKQWMAFDPAKLIDMAEEIMATASFTTLCRTRSVTGTRPSFSNWTIRWTG